MLELVGYAVVVGGVFVGGYLIFFGVRDGMIRRRLVIVFRGDRRVLEGGAAIRNGIGYMAMGVFLFGGALLAILRVLGIM